jgi:signal transduction histidine kinase
VALLNGSTIDGLSAGRRRVASLFHDEAKLKRSFAGGGMTLGFALAAVVVIGSGLLIHRNIQLIAENERLVVHTYQVLNRLTGIHTALTTAESSQRGYLITGQRDYLAGYEKAVPEIAVHLKEISIAVSDNPNQVSVFPTMASSVNQRLTSLATGIEILEKNGLDSARDFIRMGLGAEQMKQVDKNIETMVREEQRLLALRDEQSRASHRSTSQLAFLAAVVGLSMVLVAWYLSLREVRQRDKTAELLEARVRERTSELDAANTSLRASNRELEQFASVASHDLQEPLRKIEAFGDRLKMNRDALNDQSRDYLDRILSSASRMRTLINDLLSFSRIATRAQPFKPVDLAAVAREVSSDLEGRVQEVDGRIELGTLPAIEADPLQMRQLLQNLIANALKFRQKDIPPVVRVAAELVADDPERIRLTVADNGIGFEEQYLDRIFEVFQRLHGRNEFEGTGIGLAICRKIVERHGGTITARSKLGEGSTFIVTLPIRHTGKDETWEAANPLSS